MIPKVWICFSSSLIWLWIFICLFFILQVCFQFKLVKVIKALRTNQATSYCIKYARKWDFTEPYFPRIRTKSYILPLYGKIQVSENPYSRIFYAVFHSCILLLKWETWRITLLKKLSLLEDFVVWFQYVLNFFLCVFHIFKFSTYLFKVLKWISSRKCEVKLIMKKLTVNWVFPFQQIETLLKFMKDSY